MKDPKTGKDVFCRKVPTFGVAFHSRMLEKGLEKLKNSDEVVSSVDTDLQAADVAHIPQRRMYISQAWH